MDVIKRDGSTEPLSIEKIHNVVGWACSGLDVSQSEVEVEAHLMFFDKIKTSDIHEALIKAAATLISANRQDYSFVAARLLLQKLYKEVAKSTEYPHIADYLNAAVNEGRIAPALLTFDLNRINAAIKKERDLQFTYLGLQTIADRYLIRKTHRDGQGNTQILELPQHFWMRVAMGLALNEKDREARAIEFYDVLSSFLFVSSTPTLFNSGTPHSQLSSCYLNTVEDSIDGI
jgi:ribonucleoside-diphosphate reductase alpha chain